MNRIKSWFERLLESFKDDPDYMFEELILDITERFITEMELEGIDQKELIQKLNRSGAEVRVRDFFQGKSCIRIKHLVEIAHALGCELRFELVNQKKRERGRVAAELYAIKNLLAKIPQSHAIEWVGLKSRKEELEEELENFAKRDDMKKNLIN